jgi:hypothetical protein
LENRTVIPKDSRCYSCRFGVGALKALKTEHNQGDPTKVLVSILVQCSVRGTVPIVRVEDPCSKYKYISVAGRKIQKNVKGRDKRFDGFKKQRRVEVAGQEV